jgi:hypothetical protein
MNLRAAARMKSRCSQYDLVLRLVVHNAGAQPIKMGSPVPHPFEPLDVVVEAFRHTLTSRLRHARLDCVDVWMLV